MPSPFTHHASRITHQVSSNPFTERQRFQPKELIRRPGVSHVVLLQHEELVATEGGRLSQQAPESEFQKHGLATCEAERHLEFQPPPLQYPHNLVHDFRERQGLRAAQIIGLAD